MFIVIKKSNKNKLVNSNYAKTNTFKMVNILKYDF